MAVSVADAQPGVRVGITLTAADVNIVVRAIRSGLASKWEEVFGTPLTHREDIVRIRTMLDVYEGQLEMLEWGEPQADIKLECPASRLAVVAHDLLDGPEEGQDDHRVAVCALVHHMLTEMQVTVGD